MEKITKKSGSQYEIEIKLTKKETEKYLEQAIKNEIKKVKAPGFRPGKMPKKIYLQKYGIDSVYPTAVDLIVNDIYPKLIEDNKIQVVDYPNFDWSTMTISEDKGFHVKGTVDVMPEIELPDLEEIKAKVKKKDIKVSKKEIKDEINNILAQDATYKPAKDKPAKDGDIVVIDFEGFVNGKAFDGGSGKDYSLTLGSNSFIEGFEKQLEGHKAGDKVEVEVTFPENYPAEELAGKDAVFKCEIKELQKRSLPKLTEEKIKSIPGFEAKTKEELEEKIEEMLKSRKEQSTAYEYETAILEKIKNATKLNVPQNMIKEETEHTINNLQQTYQQQGFSLEMYLQMTGMDLDTFKKQLDIESELRVTRQIIIDSYLKNHDIKITKTEIKDEIKKLAEQYNITQKEINERLGEEKTPLIRDLEYRKAHDAIFS